MSTEKSVLEGGRPAPRPGRLRRAIRRMTTGSFLGAFAAGTFVVGGMGAGTGLTNSEEFCISCHEMKQNAFLEYRQTAHDVNRSGVRATCPDCHVPREWGPLLLAKVRASKDVFHHLRGTIDTPEKFEARRLAMAQTVWERMKANDSRECRNCHRLVGMDPDAQQPRAWRKHENLAASGQTCIDCHKGVAHHLPAGYEADDGGDDATTEL